jgi:hypothetical protein
MQDPKRVDAQEPAAAIAERHILTMLTMLDYLIGEIGQIDAMAARCLKVARDSLAEGVGESLFKTH